MKTTRLSLEKNKKSFKPFMVGVKSDHPLGVWLALETECHFKDALVGEFSTLLGRWYWAATGAKDDQLRVLSGTPLLRYLQTRTLISTSNLRRSLLRGIAAKFKASPSMLEAFFQAVRHNDVEFLGLEKSEDRYTLLSACAKWDLLLLHTSDPYHRYLTILNDLVRIKFKNSKQILNHLEELASI